MADETGGAVAPAKLEQASASVVLPFKKGLWQDIEPTVRAMVGDALLFLLGLIILAASFGGLLALAKLGYPPQFITTLESLHFWGYYCVIGVLLLDLFWKIVSHAFFRK